MNSKAQMFTMFAISILILLFVSYSVYTLAQDRKAIKIRVTTMDSFLSSIEQDLERQLYIYGFRSLIIAEDYVSTKGEYIPDVNEFFNLTFYNETVYEKNYTELISGANYPYILSKINKASSKINVEILLTDINISVAQEDPWHVVVIFQANLTMRDKAGLAYWNKTEVIKSYIPIEGFGEPVYIVKTKSFLLDKSKINKTLYDGNYNSAGDRSNLTSHVIYGLYAENPDAPSYLQRLEGKISDSSPNGIERLLYIPDLSLYEDQGVQVFDGKSVVDHVYFSSGFTGGSQISGTGIPAGWSWFIIDSNHDDEKYT
ncbi:MAG: hypothetical protein ABIH72_01605 [archaeon]